MAGTYLVQLKIPSLPKNNFLQLFSEGENLTYDNKVNGSRWGESAPPLLSTSCPANELNFTLGRAVYLGQGKLFFLIASVLLIPSWKESVSHA